jgi:hypothetical protein
MCEMQDKEGKSRIWQVLPACLPAWAASESIVQRGLVPLLGEGGTDERLAGFMPKCKCVCVGDLNPNLGVKASAAFQSGWHQLVWKGQVPTEYEDWVNRWTTEVRLCLPSTETAKAS